MPTHIEHSDMNESLKEKYHKIGGTKLEYNNIF